MGISLKTDFLKNYSKQKPLEYFLQDGISWAVFGDCTSYALGEAVFDDSLT